MIHVAGGLPLHSGCWAVGHKGRMDAVGGHTGSRPPKGTLSPHG